MKKSLLFVAALLVSAIALAESKTFTTKFGNKSVEGMTQFVMAEDTTFTDANGIKWTVKVTSTSAGAAAITHNGGSKPNIQIGSASKPATKVVLSGSISSSAVEISDFQATFGGAAASDYTVSLKIDGTEIASANIQGNAKQDAKPESSWAGVNGKDLVLEMTNPTAANVIIYELSYTYETTATDIENVVEAPTTYKTIYNGQVVIVRDGVRYNTVGQVVE